MCWNPSDGKLLPAGKLSGEFKQTAVRKSIDVIVPALGLDGLPGSVRMLGFPLGIRTNPILLITQA